MTIKEWIQSFLLKDERKKHCRSVGYRCDECIYHEWRFNKQNNCMYVKCHFHDEERWLT